MSSRVSVGCCLRASQCSLHNAPIFRLLLKVAVNGTHQCESHNFWWSFCSNLHGTAGSLPLPRTRSSKRMGPRWVTQKHSLRCLLEPASSTKPSLGNKQAGNWRGCSVVVRCPAGLWIGSVACSLSLQHWSVIETCTEHERTRRAAKLREILTG